MHDLVLSSRGETLHTVQRKWRQSQDKGKKGCFEPGVSSNWLYPMQSPVDFIFFCLLVFLCKTKVDLGWCKIEICLFPPFKAKTTLYPQPKSFLLLLTLGFFPPTRQRNRWMKSLYNRFQKCSCNPPMSFSKTRKKAFNLFVNVPREPLPGTSRHKFRVMASHRLYAELFWRFTQWTSATASVQTYTLPLCDVELTLVEAFAML